MYRLFALVIKNKNKNINMKEMSNGMCRRRHAENGMMKQIMVTMVCKVCRVVLKYFLLKFIDTLLFNTTEVHLHQILSVLCTVLCSLYMMCNKCALGKGNVYAARLSFFRLVCNKIVWPYHMYKFCLKLILLHFETLLHIICIVSQ